MAVMPRPTQRQLPPLASIVEWLETGRTHQIRVHMAHLGHGVIGDLMYGRACAAARPDNAARDCLAQMRASGGRRFTPPSGLCHPITGEALEFTTLMPDDMAATIEAGIARRARGEY